jgi:carbonic anhydrase
MTANYVCEIAFDGTKFYWRTRNTVDVVIVHHKDCNTFEVIIYEPTLDKEAPRIYLNEKILMPKVDHNEIDSKLSFAKRNSLPLTEKFVSGIVNKSVSDFILNRLLIKELVASEKIFLVDFRIDENEIMIRPDFSELICARPEALRPHQTKHFKHLM